MAPKIEKDKDKDKSSAKLKKKAVHKEEKEIKSGDPLPDTPAELLSPSEVVKMRKKTRLPSDETKDNLPVPDKEEGLKRGKPARAKDSDIKPKDKEAKMDKDSTKLKERKFDKSSRADSGKRQRVDKEKRRIGAVANRKKSKSLDGSDVPVVLFPCGICTKEVNDEDEAILCEAGCGFWYHRSCTGMSDFAYLSLTNEDNAEWVCDKCIATKSIPLVKLKSFEMVPS